MNYLLLLVILLVAPLTAQQLPTQLSEADFLALVAEHHPLAVRADLQRDRAQALLRQARGGFDPKLYGELAQKYFKGTRYYSLAEGGLKVPTWFGIELNASYEHNDGYYLNPENTVPEEGLFAAGLSISLGQGLFFDQRRAELQRARIYQQATEVERQLLLNELLYEAGSRYWEWAGARGAVGVYAEALELARTRYAAVVSGATFGDRPAIDTLEARIVVQNRLLGYESARLELANAAAALNAFLWLDGVIPLEVGTQVAPPDPDSVVVGLPDPLVGGPENPSLLQTRLKLTELEVDERLQREQLKPRIDIKYNVLAAGGPTWTPERYSADNYKWGISFSQSLLLRKERGKLELIRIKQSETQLELSAKVADLGAKLIQATNEAIATVAQYALARDIAGNYARLLTGERELFAAGESSLFLVNSREVAFIEASLKQLDLMVKHRKARLTRDFVGGRLPLRGEGGGLSTE